VKRGLLAVLAALLLAAAAPAASAHSARADGPSEVGLGTCDMSVAVVRDSAERLRPLLPAGYPLGKSLYTLGLAPFASIVSWTMECDGVEVPGRPPRPARLAFVGVQIGAPGRPTSVATIANEFEVYALFAHSDKRPVARWLRAGGMPARTVPDIRIERTHRVAIEVRSRSAPYALDLAPLHPDPVGVHHHSNAFWHEDARGRRVRLSLGIPEAEDVTCVLLVGICGSIGAPAGSPVAALLGSTRRQADFVFDHIDLTGGTLAFTREPGLPAGGRP